MTLADSIDRIPWLLRRLARYLHYVPTDQTPTADVTEAGVLRQNPEFLSTLTEDERVGLLMHELMHLICRHHQRCGDRDPLIWNIACDVRINAALARDGFVLPPRALTYEAVGITHAEALTLSEEAIYDRVPRPPQEETLLDLRNDPSETENPAAQERKGTIGRERVRIRTYANGALPNTVLTLLPPTTKGTDWQAPKLPAIVRALRSKSLRRSYSSPRWSPSPGVVLPGRMPAEPAKLVILVDVSGSMDGEPLKRGCRELRRMLAGRRTEAVLIAHDTERRCRIRAKLHNLPMPESTGGGTRLKAALDGESADAVIVVSDLLSSDGPPATIAPTVVVGAQTDVPETWQRWKP